jgi:PIN domain nuclease of toxin-antitoxin system
MEYLADTVAIIHHLRRHPALGHQAAQILHDTDVGQHHVYISAITLMEVLYLSEARKIDVGLQELVKHVSNSTNYVVVPVDADIVLAAVGIDDVPELHDRIIVATASHLDVPILTGGQIISQSRHVRTIW